MAKGLKQGLFSTGPTISRSSISIVGNIETEQKV